MWTSEWFVREIKLPRTVDGVVLPNDDGTFDIYLNANKPRETQKKWLRHEVNHITDNHFYRAMGIAAIEREADGLRADEQNTERVPNNREIVCFSSLDAMLRYYKSDITRIHRDYAGI